MVTAATSADVHVIVVEGKHWRAQAYGVNVDVNEQIW
jgi:hypothetical protein